MLALVNGWTSLPVITYNINQNLNRVKSKKVDLSFVFSYREKE